MRSKIQAQTKGKDAKIDVKGPRPAPPQQA